MDQLLNSWGTTLEKHTWKNCLRLTTFHLELRFRLYMSSVASGNQVHVLFLLLDNKFNEALSAEYMVFNARIDAVNRIDFKAGENNYRLIGMISIMLDGPHRKDFTRIWIGSKFVVSECNLQVNFAWWHMNKKEWRLHLRDMTVQIMKKLFQSNKKREVK